MLAISLLAYPTAAKKKPPLHPINLNAASALELQQVPGIGPSTAGKISQMRKSYGAFKSVEDLRAIKGIGPKRLEKMRKYVTVSRSVAPKISRVRAVRRAREKSPQALRQNSLRRILRSPRKQNQIKRNRWAKARHYTNKIKNKRSATRVGAWVWAARCATGLDRRW